MANHGRCENCWWYYVLHHSGYKVENSRLIEKNGKGVCYMLTPCNSSNFHYTDATCYCPDYFNRKRRKQTLQQWIEEHNVPTPQPTHNQP